MEVLLPSSRSVERQRASRGCALARVSTPKLNERKKKRNRYSPVDLCGLEVSEACGNILSAAISAPGDEPRHGRFRAKGEGVRQASNIPPFRGNLIVMRQ